MWSGLGPDLGVDGGGGAHLRGRLRDRAYCVEPFSSYLCVCVSHCLLLDGGSG